MKRFIFFFLFVFSLSLSAQVSDSEPASDENSVKKHEISLGFTNLFNNNNSFWEYMWMSEYYEDYYYYFEIEPFFGDAWGITRYGLGYKYHLKKSSVRSYIDFGINSGESEDKYPGSSVMYPTYTINKYKHNISVISARVGYEFIMKYKK